MGTRQNHFLRRAFYILTFYFWKLSEEMNPACGKMLAATLIIMRKMRGHKSVMREWPGRWWGSCSRR